MNSDYARHRRRRGRSIMKGAGVGYLKATIGAVAGLLLASELHAAGAITAGDENLIVVVLSVWVCYRALLAFAKGAYGAWIITAPPAGELADKARRRVEALR